MRYGFGEMICCSFLKTVDAVLTVERVKPWQ